MRTFILLGWLTAYAHAFLLTIGLLAGTLAGVTVLVVEVSLWFVILYPVGISVTILSGMLTMFLADRGVEYQNSTRR